MVIRVFFSIFLSFFFFFFSVSLLKSCVMYIPTDKAEILTSENESKTASNAGIPAKLRCRAVGAPVVHFSWEREGLNVTSVSEKYTVEEKRVNINTITFITVVNGSIFIYYVKVHIIIYYSLLKLFPRIFVKFN